MTLKLLTSLTVGLAACCVSTAYAKPSSETAPDSVKMATASETPQVMFLMLNGTTDRVYRTGGSIQKFWMCADDTCADKTLLVDFSEHRYRSQTKKVDFQGPITILSERRFYKVPQAQVGNFIGDGKELKSKRCTSSITFSPEKYGKYFLRLEQDLKSSPRRVTDINDYCELFVDSSDDLKAQKS